MREVSKRLNALVRAGKKVWFAITRRRHYRFTLGWQGKELLHKAKGLGMLPTFLSLNHFQF
jgi:hypothetical protein